MNTPLTELAAALALLTACPAGVVALDYREFVTRSIPHESLPHYLDGTLALSESLTNGHLSPKIASGKVLDLRNRLDNIYSLWHLQFTPELQSRLLRNLHEAVLSHPVSYVRLEAAMAIGIVGQPQSLPTLKKAQKDSDELVREYATRAIHDIRAHRHIQ